MPVLLPFDQRAQAVPADRTELPRSRRLHSGHELITHPGVALLWVPTLEGAPARAPGGCVFEEQVGVGVHNARVSEKYRCFGVIAEAILSSFTRREPRLYSPKSAR